MALCARSVPRRARSLRLFFFNDTATTEIYTLPLHDALPISFSGLALGLPRSAGARENLHRGCEVFDRCPTKAHLQRTGTGLAPHSGGSVESADAVCRRRRA